MKSIKLMDILREYKNQGPSTPEVYILDIENDKIIPSSLKEVQKISNLVYDMGGGETSYHDEYNIVIIDNFDEVEVVDGIKANSIADKKLYIKYNLENTYAFPKADKIIISQLVYYLDNIENFAKTVNDSLKPNGKIEFFSDKMYEKSDIGFIKILTEKYGFKLPEGVSLDNIKKQKSQNLIIQKVLPYKTPPEIHKFKIRNIETGEEGTITYEKKNFYWVEFVSDNFKSDFYHKNNKPMEWSSGSSNSPSKFKYPIFINTPETIKGEWYQDEYPLRFKYEFVSKIQ
jgi:hypothetical protein